MVAGARRFLTSQLRKRLSDRPVVLVGLMGAGKTSIGRLLAARLNREFVDADAEIEVGARRSIEEIFDSFGEDGFRDGERRVMARLMKRRNCVIATGGGAFDDPRTRAAVRAGGVSVWLKADVEVLLERVSDRDDRPLLRGGDRRTTLERLMAKRHPFYAEADVVVESRRERPAKVVDRVVRALAGHAENDGGSAAR